MIIDANGKSPFEIRDSTGKEFKKIYDADGNLLFKNWNTIQGTPPIVFKGYHKALKNYKIYGNTIQDGTPTPETPVEVQGCGEYDSELNGYKIPVTVSGENLATLIQGSYNANGEPNTIGNRVKTPLVPVEYGDVFVMTLNKWYFRNVAFFDESKNFIKFGNDASIVPYIYADVQNAKYISVILGDTKSGHGQGHNISPNYSPFRLEYKPITTPVYIGSEPLHKIGDYADYIDFERGVVVRNIKKIVLTGDENWIYDTHNTNQNVYRIENFANFRRFPNPNDAGSTIGIYRCDHILYVQLPYPPSLYNRIILLHSISHPYALYFSTKKSMGFDTVTKFKNFLAEKYELGQPVTIWYIAAEPEEEPLENLSPIQTIKGTNILSTNTTIQPSEIYLKGKIKSLATHMLVDSGGNVLLTSDNYQLVTKEE